MAVVVVTQDEWDHLWLDLKPQYRVFGDETSIAVGGDVVIAGSPLSLEELRKKLKSEGKLEDVIFSC
jgi:hypothetical protein